jgi:hypothetical protein
MIRLVLFIIILLSVASCGNQSGEEETEEGYTFSSFAASFREVEVPYNLTDTALLANKDTAAIKALEFTSMINDSLKNRLFGNNTIRYVPMVRLKEPNGQQYLIVKATGGKKKAALLFVYDEEGNFGSGFPFLVPDENNATSQVSSIEKSYAISRNISRRKPGEVAEGKDVFVYHPESKSFRLIMTDPLDDTMGVINPIDTMPRTHRFAGDYYAGNDALVSVRDGRNEGQLMVFVNFKKNKGQCSGELKGELFFSTSTTAVFRQSGDPCVMEFSFKGSSVTLKEEQGCGNYRDIDCLFNGTYTRKKTPAKKPAKN